MPTTEFQAAVRQIRTRITLPPKANDPVLVILSGLPGSGKTTVAAKLAQSFATVVVETDMIRKVLYPEPTYSAQENRFVHGVARSLMRYYLRLRRPVVADATNLAEWHRQMLRRLAQDCRAPAVVVQVSAPKEVIAARLDHRSTQRQKSDFSDADWRVYQMLSTSVEPIRGPFLRVDTTHDLDKSVKRIVRAVRRFTRGTVNSLSPK